MDKIQSTFLKEANSMLTSIKSSSNLVDGGEFSSKLIDAIKEVNKLQNEADKSLEDLASGKSESIHETMIAISKAETAFKLTMTIRNKLLEGYKEILNSSS
ncbi:MAG: flagellar hook-basal body complex protein FliE [Nitrospinota bacterium]